MASGPVCPRIEVAAAPGNVDWPAILTGTFLVGAISFLLLTFGTAIGLSAVSFEPREGASPFWVAIVGGLWFIWVAVTSFGAGGYLASRLRRPALVAQAAAEAVGADIDYLGECLVRRTAAEDPQAAGPFRRGLAGGELAAAATTSPVSLPSALAKGRGAGASPAR